MDRNSRAFSRAGPSSSRSTVFTSKRPSIPKYQLSTGSSIKKPRKQSFDSASGRKSIDRIARVSLNTKVTPNKAYTPVNTLAHPSTNSFNRQSIETVRSSISGKSKKPSWPVTDVSFKVGCIENIYEFLQLNGYDQSFGKHTLQSPTAKEFSLIFTFIYRHLDSSFKPSVHIEDDIPTLLKRSGYPFQMPRSSFLNVASPHTWPSILAMLSWLIDHINLMSMMDPDECIFVNDLEDKVNEQKLRFDCLIECNNVCADEANDCQDEMINAITSKFQEALEDLNRVQPDDFADLLKKKEQLTIDIKNIPNAEEQIQGLNIELSNMKEDANKLFKYNEDVKAHGIMKQNELSTLKKELENTQQVLFKHLSIIDELNQKKSRQNLSLVEISEFRNQAQHLSTLSDRLDKQIEEINQQNYEKEMTISKNDQVLRGEIYDINNKLADLGVECDEMGIACIQEQIPHWERNIIPLLKENKNNIHAKKQLAENEVSEICEQKEKLEKEAHILESEVQKQSAKVALLESEIVNIKKNVETEECEWQLKCDSMNAQNKSHQKEYLDLDAKLTDLHQIIAENNNKLELAKQNDDVARKKSISEMMKRQEKVKIYCLKRKEFVDSTNQKILENRNMFMKNLAEFNLEE